MGRRPPDLEHDQKDMAVFGSPAPIEWLNHFDLAVLGSPAPTEQVNHRCGGFWVARPDLVFELT